MIVVVHIMEIMLTIRSMIESQSDDISFYFIVMARIVGGPKKEWEKGRDLENRTYYLYDTNDKVIMNTY